MKALAGLRMAALLMAARAFAQAPPDPAQGNEIFDEQCRSCHHADSFETKVGPGLKWLYSKGKLDSGGKAVSDASVLEKINTGGKTMPAYKDSLREEDKLNLLAYLKTI